MHGNVWQWCADLYEQGGSDRVSRGGSWLSMGTICQAADRDGYAPKDRRFNHGFRLARSPVR
jgi:formylglycine-generating enzyme required for sulfatase activity